MRAEHPVTQAALGMKNGKNLRPVEIVKRSDQAKGFVVLPKRWIVERTFAWLGINRRLTKDFERYAETALAFICTAIIKLMSRRLARYADF